MATLTFRDENRVIEDPAEISRFLEGLGLWYRRFEGSDDGGLFERPLLLEKMVRGRPPAAVRRVRPFR